MNEWPKQMPVDIGHNKVFKFLGQKNWTLLSMSIFCGILFGQTKTWPISMFTDVSRLGAPISTFVTGASTPHVTYEATFSMMRHDWNTNIQKINK